jgi:hypothetical protein
MSFEPRFDHRWDLISRAIASDRAEGRPRLTPYRIDLSQRGDSILTEILNEVSRCTLILADVSTIGVLDGRPIRNANVLYEVGLAHSVRMPEEVILVRSDTDPLPFDVANVRVHSYSPDSDPDGAIADLQEIIDGALRSIDIMRASTVERTATVLDFECWNVLYDIAAHGSTSHPSRADVVGKRMGILQALPRIAGIQRLLELGAIATSYQVISARHIGGNSELPIQDLFRYRMTPFGEALLIYSLEQMQYNSDEVRSAFGALERDLASRPSTPRGVLAAMTAKLGRATKSLFD